VARGYHVRACSKIAGLVETEAMPAAEPVFRRSSRQGRDFASRAAACEIKELLKDLGSTRDVAGRPASPTASMNGIMYAWKAG